MNLQNRIEKIENFGFHKKVEPQGGTAVYTYQKSSRPKRGRKSSKKESSYNVISLKKWIVTAEKNALKQEISASLDQFKFHKNLEGTLAHRFGPKTDVEITWLEDCRFSIILKQRRPISVEDVRGYGEIPYGWNNPDGIFALTIELAFSGTSFSVFLNDYFALGYANKDTLKNVFEGLMASLGVSDYRSTKILSKASLHEIEVPIIDLISSSLKAKDSERKELLEIFEEVSKDDTRTYYKLDEIDDELKIHFSSHNGVNEYMWEKEFPICVLESRKGSKELKSLDTGLITASFNFDEDFISHDNVLLEKGILERFYLLTFLKEQYIQLDSYSALRESESMLGTAYELFTFSADDSTLLATASKLVRKFMEVYGDVDDHKAVTLCLSEFFGDLWRTSDPQKSEMSYKRALDLIGEDIRIYRKLLDLAVSTNDSDKSKEYLDILIDIEPRNTEKAKYIFERAKIDKEYGKMDSYLTMCRSAYTMDRGNFEIFDALLEELMDAKKFTEFLAVAEDHVRILGSKLSKRNKCAILFKEAKVWNEGLGRPDLSYKKLVEMEESSGADIEFKLYMAQILEALGHKKEYLRILESCLELAEELDDSQLVLELNEKLTREYGAGDYLERRNLAAKTRKWQMMIEEDDGIEGLISTIDSADTAHSLYEEVLESYLILKNDDSFSENVANRLSELFPTNEASLKIYEKMLNENKCSVEAFNFLRSKYSANWDKKDLAKLFKCRLENVSDVFEELELTEDFFKEDLSISEEFDEKLLVKILTQDTYDLAAPVLQKKILSYEAEKNTTGLIRLIYMVKLSPLGYLRKRNVYIEILKTINKMSFSGKQKLFEEFLDEIVVKSENPPELGEEMLLEFQDNISDEKRIELCRLIFEDTTFDIDLRIDYEKILASDSKMLSTYYLRAASIVDDPNKAIAYLSKSLTEDDFNHDVVVDILSETLSTPSRVSIGNLMTIRRLTELAGLTTILESYCSFWLLQNIDSENKNEIRTILFGLWSVDWDENAKINWLLSKMNDRNWFEYAREKLLGIIGDLSSDLRQSTFEQIITRNLFSVEDLDSNFGDYAWYESIMETNAIGKLSRVDSFNKLTEFLVHVASSTILNRMDLARPIVEKAISLVSVDKVRELLDTLRSLANKSGLGVLTNHFAVIIKQKIEQNSLEYGPVWGKIWEKLEQDSPFASSLVEILVAQGIEFGYDLALCEKILMSVDLDFSEKTAALQYSVLWAVSNDEKRFELLKEDIDKVKFSCKLKGDTPYSDESIQNDFVKLKKKFEVSSISSSEFGNSESVENSNPIVVAELPNVELKPELPLEGVEEIGDEEHYDEVEEDSFVVNNQSNPIDPKSPIDFSKTTYKIETAWNDDTNQNTGTGQFRRVNTVHEEYKWRDYVRANTLDEDSITRLLKSGCEQLDKHLGLQVLGVMTGNVEALNKWPMAVWRNFYYAYYPKDVEGRFPDSAISKNIVTPAAKAIVELNAYFVRAFSRKILKPGVAGILGVSVGEVDKVRKPLDVDKGVLDRSGVALFADQFASKKYKFYSIAGLSKKVFYDANERAFYIDEDYYSKVPPPHLLTRLLEKYWAIRLRYLSFMELNPNLEVKKSLLGMREEMNKTGFSILGKSNEFAKAANDFISSVGKAKAEEYLNILENISSDEIVSIQHNFKAHLYKIILAQTLDFVGVCESLTDRNLIKSPVSNLPELLSLSRYLQPLVRFALKMDLTEKTESYGGVA